MALWTHWRLPFFIAFFLVTLLDARAVDYYAALGITQTSNAEEIKVAYRKQALRFHPDRAKTLLDGKRLSVAEEKEFTRGMETKFKEIGEAYAVLSDPQKRASYDWKSSNAVSSRPTTSSVHPQGETRSSTASPATRPRPLLETEPRVRLFTVAQSITDAKGAFIQYGEMVRGIEGRHRVALLDYLDILGEHSPVFRGMPPMRILDSVVATLHFGHGAGLDRPTEAAVVTSILVATEGDTSVEAYWVLRKLRTKIRVLSWSAFEDPAKPRWQKALAVIERRFEWIENASPGYRDSFAEIQLGLFTCKQVLRRVFVPNVH